LNKKLNVLVDNFFKDTNEEDVFHIINHCNLNNLNILIISSVSLLEYEFKLKDLSSRLKTFTNIKINLPDDLLLMNLMIKLLNDKQIIVKNPEIFNYIIKRVDRSYEKVFILISKIDKLLFEKNKQLTIPLIKELI
jgi:chromosomal replication initiation ATPase DnaA